MTECEFCKKNSGLFDFNRICCRVRFIMGLPTRQMRASWLARWRARDGIWVANAVEKEVRERWQARHRDVASAAKTQPIFCSGA